MDRLKQFQFVILFFLQINIFAQYNETDKTISINESITLDCNDTAFVCGETLYYKLYCINDDKAKLSELTKIAYVTLLDNKRNKIFTQKLFLENGMADGDFFITTKIESGNYKLIGYTNWMLNKKDFNFFEINIQIINPFQISYTISTTKNILVEENNVSHSEVYPNNYEPSIIALNKKEFSTRELVNLQINKQSEKLLNGKYSVSIKKIDDLYLCNTESAKNKLGSKIKLLENEIIYYPELRGEIIAGRILSKTNSTIDNKLVCLSIPGKEFTFKLSKTNNQGKFIFNLEKPNTSSNVIVQVVDPEKENYKIELLHQFKTNFESVTFENPFKITSKFKTSIEERSIANQVQNAYYNQKKDSLQITKTLKPFYDTKETSFLLDDYTRFPTLKETTVEIIVGLRFARKNNNYTLHLKDNDINNESSNPSLVLVDGLIIQDISELFIANAENFHKISLVNGTYYIGSEVFNGIISFATKNQKYESKLNGDFLIEPTILRPLSKKTYTNPNYIQNSKLERIPDFRYQLLWNPEYNIKNPVDFYTSDVTGVFEISINGYTDKGEKIIIRDKFEVK